jgi:prepilin signal peptidase PulO-like enzyme (type II secretory pathway)
MFGSFATSLTARIPKRIFFIKEDPYCMSCKNHLRTRDLYTVFSYIYNKGICRFCKSTIPISVFVTEVIVTLIYILCYLFYGFGIEYIISTTFLSLVTISVIIYLNDRFVSYLMISTTIPLGLYWFMPQLISKTL